MKNKSRHNITEEETAVYEALKSAAISDRILELQKKGTPAQKDQMMELPQIMEIQVKTFQLCLAS